MKALKWIASIVLIIGVAGLLLFTLAGFGIKSRAKPDPPPPELIPESVRNLPVMIDELYENSIEGELLETTLIDGFPCVAGRVHFTRSGQLASCTIAEDVVIQNNLVPKGTLVRLGEQPDIQVFVFPEDTEIQGYRIRSKTGSLSGLLDLSATFYPSGRLMGFASASNAIIQGIPCGKANLGIAYIPFSGPLSKKFNVNMTTAIILYENGNLRRCTLSADAEIAGRRIPAGSEVILDEDGNLTQFDDSWQRRAGLWGTGIFN